MSGSAKPDAFLSFFPAVTYNLISDLLRRHEQVTIRVTRPRKQRSGSFSVSIMKNNPVIRINNDLKPYMFLFVFLHELAHFRVWQTIGYKSEPHGNDWKNEFRLLLEELLGIHGLDETLRTELMHYRQRIRSSLFRDKALCSIINRLDGVVPGLMLADIPENSHFILPDGRKFSKISKIRTRYRCFCHKTRRYYLIPGSTQIIASG